MIKSLRNIFIQFVLLICLLVTSLSQSASAQGSDFYDALTAIMRDASNSFADIKGKEISNSFQAIVWESGIKIPGTIASRFVFSKGLYYEGALLQTRQLSDIKPLYEQYQKLLDSCLKPMGYTMIKIENFNPGLENYKKIAFMKDGAENQPLERHPPHVAIEVTQNNEHSAFTLIMYIYEH